MPQLTQHLSGQTCDLPLEHSWDFAIFAFSPPNLLPVPPLEAWPHIWIFPMLKRKITVLCDAAAGGRAMTKLAALVSSHSGNAEEEGKLQGHFSISYPAVLQEAHGGHAGNKLSMPAQPRGCSRSRQLNSSHQGSLSPVSLSQISRGGVNASKGCPF